MKRKLNRLQLIGFVFIGLFGVLLHFLYEWSEENPIIAIFSGVNESTWEHMKLLFFPMLLFAIIESRFLKEEYPNFWCVKLRGILFGLTLIPILFYTLNGIFGKTPDWINIGIYFVSLAAALIYETRLLKRDKIFCLFEKGSVAVLLLLVVIFAVFTFYPPHIPLFKDPLTSLYGI